MKKLLAILFVLCSTYTFSEILLSGLKYKDGLYYEYNSTIPYTGEKIIYEHGYRIYSIKDGLLETLVIYDTPKKKYLKEETIFKNGEKYERTSYYEKNKKIGSHTLWEGDKFNVQRFYENGDLAEQMYTTKDGKQIGARIEYYEGNKIKEISEADPFGSKALIRSYWKNGNLQYVKDSLGYTYYDKDGFIVLSKIKDATTGDIIQKDYDEKGIITTTTIIQNDRIIFAYKGDTKEPYSGKLKSYNMNRKLELKCKFKNGKLIGKVKKYSDGQLKSKIKTKDGKLNGIEKIKGYKELHIISYVDNKLNGTEIYYDYSFIQKKLIKYITIEYKNGKKNGISTYYYMNSGDLKSTDTYVDDIKQGECIDYEDGLKIVGQNDKGKAQGVFTTYSSKGKVLAIVTYVDDKKEGEEKTYYDSGELRGIMPYIHGIKQGIYKEFDKKGNVTKTENYINGWKDGIHEKLEY